MNITSISQANGKDSVSISGFTNDQQKAYSSLIEFINSPYNPNDYKRALVGPAGTGKTYLVKALIKNCKLNEIPNDAVIFKAIEALIEPLKTPHISPITSAQKFATFAEFLINFTEVLEPAILLEAFAWNSFSSATVTATPIISKNIPISITKSNTKIAENNGKFVIELVEINEKTIDKINVVINTVTNHLILEFFSLLNFELVTLLFSATLFFELLFALLVELVESSVFVKFSLEDLSFLLI